MDEVWIAVIIIVAILFILGSAAVGIVIVRVLIETIQATIDNLTRDK